MKALTALILLAAATAAQADPEAAARAKIARYVGTHDGPALLAEPAVQRALRAAAGAKAGTVMRALGVLGPVDFVDGRLALAGNAPRQGGELEAVVCVTPHDPPQLHAALLEKGQVQVFPAGQRWDWLTLCVRDWAALAAQGRQARLKPPAAVRLGP